MHLLRHKPSTIDMRIHLIQQRMWDDKIYVQDVVLELGHSIAAASLRIINQFNLKFKMWALRGTPPHWSHEAHQQRAGAGVDAG